MSATITFTWILEMVMPTKDEVASRLAQAHYIVEPGITRIVRLVKDGDAEADPSEPIKLLEVNDSSLPLGMRPIYFRPHMASGIVYPSVIVEITPEEYDRFVCGDDQLRLPEGWSVGVSIEREPVPQVTGS
jgi:hypothetical protein